MEKDTREGVVVICVGLVWAALWVLNALYWRFHPTEVSVLIVLLLVAYAIVDVARTVASSLRRYFFK